VTQYNEQYKNLSQDETGADNALSVRLTDMGDSINNLKARKLAFKLVSENGNPKTASPTVGDTNKTLSLYLGKHVIPDGFDRLRVFHNTKRTAGTDSVTWTVVVSDGWQYVDDDQWVENRLRKDIAGTFTTSSDNYYEDVTTINVARVQSRGVWLYLLAQNGDSSTRASIYSLDIQLEKA
jgi:hypothetical protein